MCAAASGSPPGGRRVADATTREWPLRSVPAQLTSRYLRDGLWTDEDGWYASGDIGVLDGAGYLTITDRKKDIIIRGGANISAAEIEELLVRMPGVSEVAVVAAPDPRLGERARAFVRPRPGAMPPDLAGVRQHLEVAGLARQKWPEELRIVADFPRTASGKIKKYVLGDGLRSEHGGER